MKAEMHYFSNLFDKVLYMFRTGPLSIIRSISKLDKRSRYLSCQFCWLSASMVRTTLANSQQNQHDKYLLHVYSVEILLMIDSGPVQNTQSTLSNKFEKQCISLASIIRMYHDAWSSERQILTSLPSFLIKQGEQTTDDCISTQVMTNFANTPRNGKAADMQGKLKVLSYNHVGFMKSMTCPYLPVACLSMIPGIFSFTCHLKMSEK